MQAKKKWEFAGDISTVVGVQILFQNHYRVAGATGNIGGGAAVALAKRAFSQPSYHILHYYFKCKFVINS